MIQTTECLKSWMRSGLSHGTSRTAAEVDEAVKQAEEQEKSVRNSM